MTTGLVKCVDIIYCKCYGDLFGDCSSVSEFLNSIKHGLNETCVDFDLGFT